MGFPLLARELIEAQNDAKQDYPARSTKSAQCRVLVKRRENDYNRAQLYEFEVY